MLTDSSNQAALTEKDRTTFKTLPIETVSSNGRETDQGPVTPVSDEEGVLYSTLKWKSKEIWQNPLQDFKEGRPRAARSKSSTTAVDSMEMSPSADSHGLRLSRKSAQVLLAEAIMRWMRSARA